MTGEFVMEISIAHFRNNMAEPINRVVYGVERVILTRNGKPTAAIVSLEDLKLLEELENKANLKTARKALKEPGGIPWEAVKGHLKGRRTEAAKMARG
jgi:prevent-host-death family protein